LANSPASSVFSQPVCVSLPIPQSVGSLKSIAWCRSIQTLVAPSRRSTPVENVYVGGVGRPNVCGERPEELDRARGFPKIDDGVDLGGG
jgi:hypothetical protein